MLRLLSTSLAVLFGSGVAAQDLYVGGSVDYMLPHEGDTQIVTSGIAGMGFAAGPVDVGGEAEYGLHAGGDADYDTARVRVWLRYPFGDYGVLAGGGITEYYFDDQSFGGYHAMVGAERALTDSLSLRGAFIRDFVEDAFDAGITTTRVGVVFNF